MGNKEHNCSGTVEVQGTPVTGCECAVDPATPDVKGGDVTVTWTVSGCMAGTAAADIGTYAWTGPTGTSATATATVSTKGDTQSASVKVTSTENASMNVSCPSVKAINSDLPDYVIEEVGGSVSVPVGSCVSVMGTALSDGKSVRCTHSWQSSSCSYTFAAGSAGSVTETDANCNVSPGSALSISAVQSNDGQVCITEADGADAVNCTVTNW